MEFKDTIYLLAPLGDKFLAISLNNVLGIFGLEAITPIPNNKNKYLLGITNAKGNIVPVISLREKEEKNNKELLVVIESNSGKRGIIFKKIDGILPLLKEELENAMKIESPFFYLKLTKNEKEIIILDVNKDLEIYLPEIDFFKSTLKAS